MSTKQGKKKTGPQQFGQRPPQGQRTGGQSTQRAANGATVQAPARPQSQPAKPAVDSDAMAARREARIERQNAAREAGLRRRRAKQIRNYGIIGAIVVVLLGTFVALYLAEANKPGQSVPAMAVRNHLGSNVASTIPYNSDPPTNGPHSDDVPQFKVYTQPISKELAVHGLEDAGVIINHQPNLDQKTRDMLAGITTSYNSLGGGRSHVLMAPYEGLSNPIVLTAWRRIDRLDVLDEVRIRRFIDEYVGIDHHEGSEGKRLP